MSNKIKCFRSKLLFVRSMFLLFLQSVEQDTGKVSYYKKKFSVFYIFMLLISPYYCILCHTGLHHVMHTRVICARAQIETQGKLDFVLYLYDDSPLSSDV